MRIWTSIESLDFMGWDVAGMREYSSRASSMLGGVYDVDRMCWWVDLEFSLQFLVMISNVNEFYWFNL